jgi:uncharacterized repeat protein (TIGR02543 family)/LPXTG-motif cell wall-anchored protein
VFRNWSVDSTATTPQASVAMAAPRTVTALWRTEHRLTIVSPYGNTQGADWYPEGDLAAVSVESTAVANGTTYRFTGWTGDATSRSASFGVTMDGPKTIRATWEAVPPSSSPGLFDNVFLWIALLAVILFLLALFVWRRRRKDETDEPPPT